VALGPARLYRDLAAVQSVKLRYRSTPVACRARASQDGLVLELEQPFRGAAPGQTACLLRGEEVVGWGTIAEPSATVPVPLPLATSAHD
jgi:tRNA-specific 2-thiouridylase